MQKFIWIATILVVTTFAICQDSAVDKRPESLDQEHTQWIQHVMKSIATIKPGMTRQQLLRILTTEGGLSTRSQRRYVYKHCPYIKVDVKFSPSGEGPGERPDDKIVEISRPYLQYAIYD